MVRTSGKILVTGASGFIGTHLCERLVRRGGEIHAISRSGGPFPEGGIRWWTLDLADTEGVRDVINAIKPELIFHLASHVSGARELDRVIPTFRDNFLSSLNLFVSAAETGCNRLILAGSMEEQGAKSPGSVPGSPYAAAKWASGMYARFFYALYDLPVVLLRIFMVFGPGQRDFKKLVPHVIRSLFEGEAPQLSSGQREVDWIYVGDVVEGLLLAADADGVEGESLDIGSGELVTIREVVNRLVMKINPAITPDFGALADRRFETTQIADWKSTFEKTGWRPETSLDDGLDAAVAWYRQYFEERGISLT